MSAEAAQRIGLFGGSFDPIHNGHLQIAAAAVQQFGLARVLFIPAARSPLKAGQPTIPTDDRLELIRRTIAPHPKFELSLVEIDRGGTSYSYQTAAQIASERPEARLYWILGGDQARQLDQWREIDTLAQTVEFICLDRDEATRIPDSLSDRIRVHSLEIPPIAISSTAIRAGLKSGNLPKYCLPDPVLHYIKARNLYGDDLSEP